MSRNPTLVFVGCIVLAVKNNLVATVIFIHTSITMVSWVNFSPNLNHPWHSTPIATPLH